MSILRGLLFYLWLSFLNFLFIYLSVSLGAIPQFSAVWNQLFWHLIGCPSQMKCLNCRWQGLLLLTAFVCLTCLQYIRDVHTWMWGGYIGDIHICTKSLTRRHVWPQTTTTSHSPVVLSQAKPMFNQSSYRFQKSQGDKCSWKQPADRAMSDWARPWFRKQSEKTSITRADVGCWFH